MQMSIKDTYTDWSETYDQDPNKTRDLDEQVTREALENLRCEHILELGCGTGKNTALLTEIGQRVSAIDFSAGMIARARQKISAANVTFAVADLTQPWPFADSFFDLVVCNLVLEHISDLGFIFAEALRVLTGTGKFFVSELHPFRQYQGTQARFQRDSETIKIPAFVHHISEFIDAAATNNLTLSVMKESWHDNDEDQPPRLVSFLFEKRRRVYRP